MGFWRGRRVLVTGGAGFIGSHVVERLVQAGARVRVADNLERGTVQNLRACRDDVELLHGDLCHVAFAEKACAGQEVVLHLAAKVGGVGYNVTHQGSMFYANVALNTAAMEAARRAGVARFLLVSSACVYRRDCPVPTPEEEGFVGDPEPTNLGYGWAKRVAELQACCYALEYPMQIAIVRPYNCYGPRDDFSPETAHVIPALIHRVCEGEDPVTVWGHGEQTRAFVYVEDLAEGVLLAAENAPAGEPLNLGTDEEVKVRDLVGLVIAASGRNPRVLFDSSRPAGQPRRNADISKAKHALGYQPRVALRDGLQRTMTWYQANQGRR